MTYVKEDISHFFLSHTELRKGDSEQKAVNDVQVTSVLSENDKTILLQSAEVWAQRSRHQSPVRCLMHGGIRRTFVTKDATRELASERFKH